MRRRWCVLRHCMILLQNGVEVCQCRILFDLCLSLQKKQTREHSFMRQDFVLGCCSVSFCCCCCCCCCLVLFLSVLFKHLRYAISGVEEVNSFSLRNIIASLHLQILCYCFLVQNHFLRGSLPEKKTFPTS